MNKFSFIIGSLFLLTSCSQMGGDIYLSCNYNQTNNTEFYKIGKISGKWTVSAFNPNTNEYIENNWWAPLPNETVYRGDWSNNITVNVDSDYITIKDDKGFRDVYKINRSTGFIEGYGRTIGTCAKSENQKQNSNKI